MSFGSSGGLGKMKARESGWLSMAAAFALCGFSAGAAELHEIYVDFDCVSMEFMI